MLNDELLKFIEENKYEKNLDKLLKKKLIDVALVKTRGNQSETARMLGINRGGLRMFISNQ